MVFSVDSFPDGPKLDTKKALVLIDFQNDFVASTGALPVPNVLPFLPKLPSLVKRFREQDEIVWVRTEFSQSRPSLSIENGGYTILLTQFADKIREENEQQASSGYHTPALGEDEGVGSSTYEELAITLDAEAFLAPELPKSSSRCCLPGSLGSQYPAKLQECVDTQRDLVVVKSHYSAFTDFSLLLQLRTRLVTHLYVCGSLSNIGVYATVLDAVRQGFNVTLIEDCLGYRNELSHLEAMKQMADNLGADGVDFQELMDDLAGMLGDVVDEANMGSSFQVSVQPPSMSRGMSHSQKVSEWIASMEQESIDHQQQEESFGTPSNMYRQGTAVRPESKHDESHTSINDEAIPPTATPPRKRSASDQDELEEERISKLTSIPAAARRASYGTYSSASGSSAKRPRPRKTLDSTLLDPLPPIKSQRPCPLKAIGQSLSTGDLPDHLTMPEQDMATLPDASPSVKRVNGPSQYTSTKRQKLKSNLPSYLGPEDVLGDGDCLILHDLLDHEEAHRSFSDLKAHVRWQKMYHRSGEVPRLVAVQGDTSAAGNVVPIYRHPADESPELLPFDTTVDMLRRACEKQVRHPLNHVLIQHYRNGEDNISEHSDKTLDIVRGTKIVNLSLGAMRTMTLRTKKIPSNVEAAGEHETTADQSAIRMSQRIRLPHNSLFVLGQRTNANWLHAIRADKRPELEKSPEELAYGGERISLTFRHIGTFIDTRRGLIWGQGARSKTQSEARKILAPGSITAEREGEEMIKAFGRENHDDGKTFDWDEWYGEGFDVVNFVTKPV